MPAADGNTKKEIEELLQDVICLAGYDSRRKEDNVLLVGLGGVGKSSLINTVSKSLRGGKFRAIAVAGAGTRITGEVTRTLRMSWYKRMGLSASEFPEGRRNEIRDILNKLPSVVDFSALRNEDTQELAELLFLALNGYIPPGSKIEDMSTTQATRGPGYLTKQYSKQDPAWRISVVLFVHSGLEPVPIALIQCLRRTIRKLDHDVRSYVVLTKYDMVTTEDMVERFTKTREDMADAFAVVGQEEHNIIRWRNYCTDVGFNDPEIDKASLTLLTMILTPGPEPHDPVTPERPFFLEVMHFIKQCFAGVVYIIPKLLLLALMVLMFMVILGVLIERPKNSPK